MAFGLPVTDLTIVGLGPAGLDRLSQPIREALEDDNRTVIVRTLAHPAAAALAESRPVTSCDDLYESAEDFEGLYAAIAERVATAAEHGPVVYAVPGSTAVGERSVTLVAERTANRGMDVANLAGESFLDLVFATIGLDPIDRGVQVVDGRDLPDPLPLHLPLVVTQLDRREVLGDVLADLGRILPDDTAVILLDRLGDADEAVLETTLSEASQFDPGPRTTLFVDPPPAGWHGLVTTNRLLREECPWDASQTHHSLVGHLIEEAYEVAESLGHLDTDAPRAQTDLGAYAHVEEELGDLLLQVVFHATLASEAGAFDVEEVAEGIRRKLVRRHPHVFGDVVAETSQDVEANWEALKEVEKERQSLMDDMPSALPAIALSEKLQNRAASVGFDWTDAPSVMGKVEEEVAELREAVLEGDKSSVHAELGDLLFTVINVARHLDVDADLALRSAARKFADRFRTIEAKAAASGVSLRDVPLREMNAWWDSAKS